MEIEGLFLEMGVGWGVILKILYTGKSWSTSTRVRIKLNKLLGYVKQGLLILDFQKRAFPSNFFCSPFFQEHSYNLPFFHSFFEEPFSDRCFLKGFFWLL